MYAVTAISGRARSQSTRSKTLKAAQLIKAGGWSVRTITPGQLVTVLNSYAAACRGRARVTIRTTVYRASASAVRGMRTGCTNACAAVGRVGAWVSNGRGFAAGNPSDSPAVQAFVEGYAQAAFDQGVDAAPSAILSDGAVCAFPFV